MIITSGETPPNVFSEFVDADAIQIGDHQLAVDCPADHIPEAIVDAFERISVIRIPFAGTGDGRGFSIAKSLRERGYKGRLRASGKIISDQLRYAIECGFDEIEVDAEIAARQPAALWTFKPRVSYRQKLAQY